MTDRNVNLAANITKWLALVLVLVSLVVYIVRMEGKVEAAQVQGANHEQRLTVLEKDVARIQVDTSVSRAILERMEKERKP